MNAALSEFTLIFPAYIALVSAAIGLWLAASALYVLLSPFRSSALFSLRSASSGIVLIGTAIGLGLPILASLITKPSLASVMVWSIVCLLLTMTLFRILDGLIGPLSRTLSQNRTNDAWLLTTIKLIVALILSIGMGTPALAG